MSSGDRVRRVMGKGIPPKTYETGLYVESTSGELYTYDEYSASPLSSSQVKGITGVYNRTDGRYLARTFQIKPSLTSSYIAEPNDWYSDDWLYDSELSESQGDINWYDIFSYNDSHDSGYDQGRKLKTALTNAGITSSALDLATSSWWIPSYHELDPFYRGARDEYNDISGKTLDNFFTLVGGTKGSTILSCTIIDHGSTSSIKHVKIRYGELDGAGRFETRSDYVYRTRGAIRLCTKSAINNYD